MRSAYRIPGRLGPLMAALMLLVHGPAGAQEPRKETRQRVQWFMYDAPEHWFGDTRDAIAARLGRPGSVSFRLNPNPQDTSTVDTVWALRYDSAAFVIYAVTRPHHEFLVEATVTGSRYLRSSPVALGAPVSRVRAYFGDTSRDHTSSLTYYCTWCDDAVAGSSVTLWFRKGRLAGVKWEYKID
jgi:hypothetical protein